MDFTLRLNRDDQWTMHRPHMHEQLEILLSLTDSGSFFLKDNRHALRRGTLIVMQDRVLHRSVAVEGAYERYVLHVPQHTLREASTGETDFAAVFQGNACIQLEEPAFRKIRGLMEQCLRQPEELGDDVLRDCAFLSLLVTVGRLLAQPTLRPEPTEGLSLPVRQAIDRINADLSGDLSLDALAAQCYVTKYHLCRLFREETGFAVGEYIIRLRVLRAAALLRGGASVQQAAEKAGFRNYNHFIRTFGSLMGLSPGRYRRQHQIGSK